MLLFETVDEAAQLVPTMSSETSNPIADLDLVQEIENRLARTDTLDTAASKRRSSPFMLNLDSLNSPRTSHTHHPRRRMSEVMTQLLRSSSLDDIPEMHDITTALQTPTKPNNDPMDYERTIGLADIVAQTHRPPIRTSEANAIACIAEIAATTPQPQQPVVPKSSSDDIQPCSTLRSSTRPRRTQQSPKPSEAQSAKKAKSKKGNAGKAQPVPQPDSIPLPLQPGGPLPLDHRPARGRGRAQQLKSMTKAQIEAEALAMQEKNRLAARELRLKRKKHEAQLEARVAELERKDAESKKLIAKLQAKLHWFERDN